MASPGLQLVVLKPKQVSRYIQPAFRTRVEIALVGWWLHTVLFGLDRCKSECRIKIIKRLADTILKFRSDAILEIVILHVSNTAVSVHKVDWYRGQESLMCDLSCTDETLPLAFNVERYVEV